MTDEALLRNKEIFVKTCKIIENLVEDEDEVILERRTRFEESTVKRYLYHDYLMRDELKSAEQSVIKEIGNILDRLSEVLKPRFSWFLDNCIFKDIASIAFHSMIYHRMNGQIQSKKINSFYS